MKKLIYALAVLAMTMLTACGGGSSAPKQGTSENTYQPTNTVPKKLQAYRDSLMNQLRSEGMDEGSDIYLEDIFFEGDDLICQRVAREEELDGQSITYFWEKMGYNSPRYVESLKMDMVEFLITKEPRLAELLREYRYNFVFRFVGNRSRDRYDIKVSYNEIY